MSFTSVSPVFKWVTCISCPTTTGSAYGYIEGVNTSEVDFSARKVYTVSCGSLPLCISSALIEVIDLMAARIYSLQPVSTCSGVHLLLRHTDDL
jgi:hypothetical protein